jgi:hypothetical protein
MPVYELLWMLNPPQIGTTSRHMHKELKAGIQTGMGAPILLTTLLTIAPK